MVAVSTNAEARPDRLEQSFEEWASDRERPVGLRWAYPRDTVEAESLRDPAVNVLLHDLLGTSSWPEVRQCQGQTRSGAPCRQGSLPFSAEALCLSHSPEPATADAVNRQACWAWWCITHGHLGAIGHQLRPGGCQWPS